MKKCFYTIILATSLLSLVSCSKEASEISNNKSEKVHMTFGVSLSEDSEKATRAMVSGLDYSNPDKPGQSVIWEKDDKITIFAENYPNGDEFKFNNYSSPRNKATFDGMSYADAGKYYGLYPAQSNAKLSYDAEGKGIISLNIPNKQTAVKGSFDPKAGIQIGVAESWEDNEVLGLCNVCAYFSVTLDPGCESVVVTAQANAGNPEWYLAGNVTAKPSSASTAIVSLDNSNCQSSITLSGGNLADGGTFLIPFIPSTKCPKIHLVINYYPNSDKGQQITKDFVPTTKSGLSTYQFNAASIYDLGTHKYTKTN